MEIENGEKANQTRQPEEKPQRRKSQRKTATAAASAAAVQELEQAYSSDDETSEVRDTMPRQSRPSSESSQGASTFDEHGRRRSARLMKGNRTVDTPASFKSSARLTRMSSGRLPTTKEAVEPSPRRPGSIEDSDENDDDDAYNETMENDNEISDWGDGDQWSVVEPASSCPSNNEEDTRHNRSHRKMADKRPRRNLGTGRQKSRGEYSEDDSIGDIKRRTGAMMRNRPRDVSPSSESSVNDTRKRLSAPMNKVNTSSGMTSRRRRTGGHGAKSRSSVGNSSDVSLNYGADEEGSVTQPKARSQESKRVDPSKIRRFESKLQNPSVRNRLGKKALSPIPAEEIAPMSPLLSMSSSQLEEAALNQEHRGKKEPGLRESQTRNSRQSQSQRSKAANAMEKKKSSEKQQGRDTPAPQRLKPTKLDTGRKTPANARSYQGTRPSDQRSTSCGDVMPKKSKEGLRRTASTQDDTTAKNNQIFVHGEGQSSSWGNQISILWEENDNEHATKIGKENIESVDGDQMRIRVIVRKRPMAKAEAASRDEMDVIHPLHYPGYGRVLVYQPRTRVDLTREVETIPFAFDNVFDEGANNVKIYERAVRGVIPGVFMGRWSSVFAYGQTGSGKTFTMMGSGLTGIKAGNQNPASNNPGLYYLAAKDVFRLAQREENGHLSFGISLFEIYGGKLFDLLNNRHPVKCLENHKGKVCFPGLSEHPVQSAEDVMSIIEQGAANRSTGTTSANADSSRSHAVLQISLRKNVGRKANIEHGRLTFIDLAGSERGADTSQASRATRLEGAEINTSLLALKEVIRALATGDSMSHIPFRSSKLTQVLKESFVGKNSQCVMVACIAPNTNNCEHTLNTLRYADRVKERDSNTGALSSKVAKDVLPQVDAALQSFVVEPEREFDDDIGEEDFDDLLEDETPPEEFDDGELEQHEYEEDEQEYEEEDDEDQYEEAEQYEEDLYDEEQYEEDEESAEDAPEADESGDVAGALLAEILDNPDPNFAASNAAIETRRRKLHSVRSTDLQEDVTATASSRKEAAAELALAHRKSMASMLKMVKHEMTIVNEADSDRQKMEDYLEEMEKLQDEQLTMISGLRKSLVGYYSNRGGTPSSPGRKQLAGVVGESDEEDFEDLRD